MKLKHGGRTEGLIPWLHEDEMNIVEMVLGMRALALKHVARHDRHDLSRFAELSILDFV